MKKAPLIDFPSVSGFTLIELVMVLAIIGVISAIAIPAFSALYSRTCLYSVSAEVVDMATEARQKALEEKYHAITFDPDKGRISLVSDRGPDGKWNTADDVVVRSFTLREKGSGLSFGFGKRGPIKGLAAPADGISFQNNALVCNPDLTGSAGTVYIQSSTGAAVAITMNSEDFGCKIYHWNGNEWMRQ